MAPARSFPYATEGPVRMALLSYPLLVVGDQAVAWALIPSGWVVLHAAVAALGVAGFLWLLSLYRSMVGRPHSIDGAMLHLHRGNLRSAVVKLDDVMEAARVDAEAIARLPEAPLRLDLGGERVLLTLREPVAGRRASRTVLVSAEDPGALCAAVARHR